MTIHRSRNRKFLISNRRNNDQVHVCKKNLYFSFLFIYRHFSCLFIYFKFINTRTFQYFYLLFHSIQFRVITLHYISFYADMF